MAKTWLRGCRIGHFHPLPVSVPSRLLLPVPPIPGVPSAVVWGSRKGLVGAPHGSFKKPTTGSRNQLKVTAGTCGLGRERREEGWRREQNSRDQNEITARERAQPERSGNVGAAEQGLQGGPTHGCPPTPAWTLEALPCPPSQSPAPSLVPSKVPMGVQAKQSPRVPPAPSWECQSHILPTGIPGFPSSTGAKQEGAAGRRVRSCIPKLLPCFPFKEASSPVVTAESLPSFQARRDLQSRPCWTEHEGK